VREIPAAAERIWANYAETAARATAFYDRSLDFAAHFPAVADFMASL
jgi:hypothetical protein